LALHTTKMPRRAGLFKDDGAAGVGNPAWRFREALDGFFGEVAEEAFGRSVHWAQRSGPGGLLGVPFFPEVAI